MKINNINNVNNVNNIHFLNEKKVNNELDKNKYENNKNTKSKKVITYTLSSLISAAAGTLHGIYKRSTINYDDIKHAFKFAKDDKSEIKVIRNYNICEEGKIAVLLKKIKNGSIWKILEDATVISEKNLHDTYTVITEILNRKQDKSTSLFKISYLSIFKKVIDPAEARFLNKLKSIKILRPLVEKYNKSDDIMRSLYKDYFYNKTLVLKGAGVGLVIGLLCAFCADKIFSKKEQYKNKDD